MGTFDEDGWRESSRSELARRLVEDLSHRRQQFSDADRLALGTVESTSYLFTNRGSSGKRIGVHCIPMPERSRARTSSPCGFTPRSTQATRSSNVRSRVSP